MQLDKIASAFEHAALNIPDVGDLRAEMKMQHLQAVAHTGFAQPLDHPDHLCGGEAELGLFAAGVLPLAGADRGEPHPHPQQRRNPQGLRFTDHQFQLGKLFDHDIDLMPELAADQGQANIFAILVTVTDDHPARAGQAQYRHQLRFAAGLQANPLLAMLDQLPDHAGLLIDLDGIHCGVLTAIGITGHGLVKALAECIQTIVQDIGKTNHDRQGHVMFAYDLIGQLIEIDAPVLCLAIGVGQHMSLLADSEIILAPVRDAIGGKCLLSVPV